MRIRFTAGKKDGERVRDVEINGAELKPDHIYTVGGCERDGEPMNIICRLQEVQEPAYIPGTIHSVLKAYLKAHSPVAPTREGRVRATDLPPVVFSQYGTLQKLWNLPGDAAAVAVPER